MGLGLFNDSIPLLSILDLRPPTNNFHPFSKLYWDEYPYHCNVGNSSRVHFMPNNYFHPVIPTLKKWLGYESLMLPARPLLWLFNQLTNTSGRLVYIFFSLKATPTLHSLDYFSRHIRSWNCFCNFVCVAEYSLLKFRTSDQFYQTVYSSSQWSHLKVALLFFKIGTCNMADAGTHELRTTAILNSEVKYDVWESVLEKYAYMSRT